MSVVEVPAIAAFDWIVGSIAALGLLYVLVSRRTVVHYRRFFRTVTAGLLLFAVTGPVVGVLEPALIHAVHGVSALAVTAALYGLVRRELDRGEGFDALELE